MEKRLLLNGVQMNCAGVSIDQAVIFSIPVLTHPAKTSFPLGNMAPLRAQFTLDFSSTQGSEIGRELCLNETLFARLRSQGLWKTEELRGRNHTETRPTKLQEFPFCQFRIGNVLTPYPASFTE
jgi:hypothetical protein